MVTAVAARPMEITAEWLEAADACEEQVELFRATFGERAELTRSDALRAARAGLDLEWLTGRILPAPARRAYKEAMATALRAYKEAMATALCDALGLD